MTRSLTRRSAGSLEAKARALGLVSLAIGTTEIAAPTQVAHLLGVGDGHQARLLRTLGVRELMHRFDILAHDDPAPGVWSRVAGDLLDGVLLGGAARKTRNLRGFLTACALVLPVVVADIIIAERLRCEKARRSWLTAWAARATPTSDRALAR